MVGSRHTQSRQSIFFRSASWFGCLTRKHDRHTNSPGCLGSTRSTPSPVRSSGSGVSSSSSTSSTTRPLLQDGVEAGLDVLVVGLLLVVLLRLLARPWWPPWPRPRGSSHDLVLVLLHRHDVGVVVVVGKGQVVLGNQVVVHQLVEVSLDELVGSFDFVEFLWHLGLSVVSWAGA